MSSERPRSEPDDVGLLAPARVGSEVEAATGDVAYLAAMLAAEVALARAQAALGMLPAEAAEAVAAAAELDKLDVRAIAERARSGGNPVIPLVSELRAAAPSAHHGATSQDILDTAQMLVASRACAAILADLDRTAAVLASMAVAHRDTAMAGRTLTQHAVPTTFGLKAAGWRRLVLDARERLARLAFPVQLGGAAGTLAAYGEHGVELVARYAAELGLAEPALPWHALRTPVADLGAALAFSGGALGKLAADVLVLSRTEIGEVAEGGGGGSSAMPHKANPVRATLIAAAARQLPQYAAILFGSLCTEDERGAGGWHAEWQTLRTALRLAGGAARNAAELTGGLVVHPDRMRANLGATGGLIVSERVVAALTPYLGADARDAVTRAAAQGRDLAAVLAEAGLDADRVAEILDPGGYLGAAAELVDRAINPETS